MFGVVVDQNGYMINFVNILENDVIDTYILKEDENIITTDWQIAISMNKPRWNGVEWVEEAIENIDDDINKQPVEPTLEELQQELIDTLGQELAMLKIQLIMGGVI